MIEPVGLLDRLHRGAPSMKDLAWVEQKLSLSRGDDVRFYEDLRARMIAASMPESAQLMEGPPSLG